MQVIIFALRDIAAGEELTYDYRFSGDEQLRCDCGAASCGGRVNKPPTRDSSAVEAPRAKLRPLLTREQLEQLMAQRARVAALVRRQQEAAAAEGQCKG